MANDFLYGSLCLSAIPKRLIKKVKCKDGQERAFLDIKISRRKEVSQFGHTHFISCEPREQSERVEGENYFIGDVKEYNKEQSQQPAAPMSQPAQQDPIGDLPF